MASDWLQIGSDGQEEEKKKLQARPRVAWATRERILGADRPAPLHFGGSLQIEVEHR